MIKIVKTAGAQSIYNSSQNLNVLVMEETIAFLLVVCFISSFAVFLFYCCLFSEKKSEPFSGELGFETRPSVFIKYLLYTHLILSTTEDKKSL